MIGAEKSTVHEKPCEQQPKVSGASTGEMLQWIHLLRKSAPNPSLVQAILSTFRFAK